MSPESSQTTRALMWSVLMMWNFRIKKSGQMNWSGCDDADQHLDQEQHDREGVEVLRHLLALDS